MALRHPTGGVDLLLKVSVLELLRNLVGRADSGDDAVAIDDDGTVDQLSTLRVPVIDDFNLVHGRSAQHLLVVLGNHHELLRIANNESEGFLHRIGCRFMTVSLGENWGLCWLAPDYFSDSGPFWFVGRSLDESGGRIRRV